MGSIGAYLRVVHDEAATRGYRFAADKITRARALGRPTVTRAQLQFEWRHLLQKLKVRDPQRLAQINKVKSPRPHPLFRVVRGDVAQWERGATPRAKPSRR